MKKILSLLILSVIIFSPLVTLADVWVNGYYRSNGTYVKGHYRSSPDSSPYNNYSYPGNTNPYTGKTATGNPSTYLNNYYDTPSYTYTPTYVPTYTAPTYTYPTYTPSVIPSYTSFTTRQLTDSEIQAKITSNPYSMCSSLGMVSADFLRCVDLKYPITSYTPSTSVVTPTVTTLPTKKISQYMKGWVENNPLHYCEDGKFTGDELSECNTYKNHRSEYNWIYDEPKITADANSALKEQIASLLKTVQSLQAQLVAATAR